MQQLAYSKNPKHKFLQKFTRKNAKIFNEKPLKKSKYTSIAKLDELLVKSEKEIKLEPKITGKGRIISLEQALREMPETIQKILEKEEKAKDQYEGFVNSNFNSSFVLVIGKEANNETINLELNLENGIIAKYFIIVEENVKVSLIERLKGEGTVICGETAYLKNNATLNHARINDLGEKSIIYQQLILERDSSLVNSNFWFNGKLVRANTVDVLEGQGANAKDYNILLSKEKDHFDLNYKASHRGTDTSTHCIFKAVLRDESKNVFDGMILIEPSGERTNALLECHSMILGEKASSNQIPGLEIKTDDVKATHSATVARIEEDELFYLESKGISRAEAKRMIVTSFLESVIFQLPLEIQQPLREEFEKRI